MAASKRLATLLGACALACGAGADDSAEGGSAPPNGSFGGSSSVGIGGGGGTAPLPPEQELETSYRAPVVTGRYVWSANPDSGRIAVIDPETLVVRLAEANFRPTELAALPAEDADRAVVINSGSDDAT